MLHFGRLLSLLVWIGGISFFAFVVAPVAFGRLSSAHEAGLVVGGTLRVLHVLGLCCGTVFLVLSMFGWRGSAGRLRAEYAMAAVMILLTAYSEFRVLPAMEVVRSAAGGEIETVDRANPARVQFERLHTLSERLEGTVLVGGLVLLFLVAGEDEWDGTNGTGRLES